MPLFDAEGKEITDVTAHLTPEQIKAIVTGSEDYQTVLAETIDRRKTIKKLKEEKGKVLETAVEATADEEKPAVTPPAPVDEEALTAKVVAKLDARQQAAADRAALVDKILTENKIPLKDHFRTIVGTGANEEAMRSLAAAVVGAGLRFDETPGGNGRTDVDSEGLMANVTRKLFPNGTK
jgi:hypothetical protein